ncbi:MAG: hypothetical protein HOG49_17040 [Candidatus Scalindua sp.]|jgi:hypothetical protein|nr:hypothetical protein [Candidatus Scalindua sp.]
MRSINKTVKEDLALKGSAIILIKPIEEANTLSYQFMTQLGTRAHLKVGEKSGYEFYINDELLFSSKKEVLEDLHIIKKEIIWFSIASIAQKTGESEDNQMTLLDYTLNLKERTIQNRDGEIVKEDKLDISDFSNNLNDHYRDSLYEVLSIADNL